MKILELLAIDLRATKPVDANTLPEVKAGERDLGLDLSEELLTLMTLLNEKKKSVPSISQGHLKVCRKRMGQCEMCRDLNSKLSVEREKLVALQALFPALIRFHGGLRYGTRFEIRKGGRIAIIETSPLAHSNAKAVRKRPARQRQS